MNNFSSDGFFKKKRFFIFFLYAGLFVLLMGKSCESDVTGSLSLHISPVPFDFISGQTVKIKQTEKELILTDENGKNISVTPWKIVKKLSNCRDCSVVIFSDLRPDGPIITIDILRSGTLLTRIAKGTRRDARVVEKYRLQPGKYLDELYTNSLAPAEALLENGDKTLGVQPGNFVSLFSKKGEYIFFLFNAYRYSADTDKPNPPRKAEQDTAKTKNDSAIMVDDSELQKFPMQTQLISQEQPNFVADWILRLADL